MADIKIDGRMKVGALKKQFKEAFGSTLRVYKGNQFASDDATLASIREGNVTGGDFTCGGNLRVGNFEDKVKELYGITVQVANADDTKLADNSITLVAAGKEQGAAASAPAAPAATGKVQMATYKEYTITRNENESIEVFKQFKNAEIGLKECATSIGFPFPPSIFAQGLGTKLLIHLNDGDTEARTAITGEYIISREIKNNVTIGKLYSNTKEALREIATLSGYKYDSSINTRSFGWKLIKAINSGEIK